MNRFRERLLKLLLEKSFRYSEMPLFTLASGKKSPYYIDCKPVMFDPEGRMCIGEIAYPILREYLFYAIGGLTLGADPLAIAVSDMFFKKGRNINVFSVRKEPKKHGLELWIEGGVIPGVLTLIVEDVITTGSSAIKAITLARNSGLDVQGVLALMDREAGGTESILEHDVFVKSLFTWSELTKIYWKEYVTNRR